MKILHAIFTMETGGAETMLTDIINRQCRSATVSLIVVNDKVNPVLLQAIDGRITVFLLKRKESSKLQLLRTYFEIRRTVKQIRPDVIHCHDYKLFPFFARWRKKTCLTVHGTNLSTLFVKRFGRLFTISEAVRKDVKSRTGKDSTVIYNGIELEKYLMKTACAFQPNEEFKIVQIGRLKPAIKGQDVAIRAMKLFLEQHPDTKAKLYLVGGGDGEQPLKDLAGGENAVFCGEKDRIWIQNHLKDFHILIQPSLFEGFGLTVVEGFAAGLPVIASNIDGPKEIFDILKAGLPVNAGDADDLAAKIRLVYENYLSGEIQNSGFFPSDSTQLKMFDIQTTAENYMKAYIH